MEETSGICAPNEKMALDREVRYFDSDVNPYGQGDCEVSWCIPLGRINWVYPKQAPIHHRA
jgi:aminobenzoyl-glutamate utilization protein B